MKYAIYQLVRGTQSSLCWIVYDSLLCLLSCSETHPCKTSNTKRNIEFPTPKLTNIEIYKSLAMHFSLKAFVWTEEVATKVDPYYRRVKKLKRGHSFVAVLLITTILWTFGRFPISHTENKFLSKLDRKHVKICVILLLNISKTTTPIAFKPQVKTAKNKIRIHFADDKFQPFCYLCDCLPFSYQTKI